MDSDKTNFDIESAKRKLSVWQTPASLAELVDSSMIQVGQERLFNQGGLGFLRDAWIAAEFAKARSATCVSLVDDVWPDFQLRFPGRIELFEAVEANHPDRRRGDEYKEFAKAIHDHVANWVARAASAPSWITSACQRKIEKNYGGKTNLVIYLNMTEYGIRKREVEKSFAPASMMAKDHFRSIWILWNDRAYAIWTVGNPAT